MKASPGHNELTSSQSIILDLTKRLRINFSHHHEFVQQVILLLQQITMQQLVMYFFCYCFCFYNNQLGLVRQ